MEWTLDEAHDRRDDTRVAPRRFEGRYVSPLPALVAYLSMYLAQRVILQYDFGCCERVRLVEIVPCSGSGELGLWGKRLLRDFCGFGRTPVLRIRDSRNH